MSKNNSFNALLEFDPTALIVVMVIDVTLTSSKHSLYSHLLRNTLCHLERSKMSILLFVIGSNDSQLKRDQQSFQSLYPALNIFLFPYPTEFFWQIVRSKTNSISVGTGRASFSSDYPSFQHFGALVMLVPIFLLLELGRDVFYIDSDVVLLQDALQYIKNASKSYPELNMIVSQETRSCLFPSFYRINALATPLSQSHDVEPNTGIMVR